MPITLHNLTWEGVRFVQVETQAHHLKGILLKIRERLENSDCSWEDIYSAHYESEEDSTITFYEGEGVKAGQPGLWTYVFHECTPGREEIVANPVIETSGRSLKLKRVMAEVMATFATDDPTEQVEKLREIATKNDFPYEFFLSFHTCSQQHRSEHNFEAAAHYILEKNNELYRRLA